VQKWKLQGILEISLCCNSFCVIHWRDCSPSCC